MMNSSSLENFELELMPSYGYIASAIVLFFIGFFGFFLNLFVILLIWQDRQLWTPLNIILLNLVCSDFTVSVLGNPWTFTAAIARRWVFGRSMCMLYGFIMSFLGIASITTLTVLAFERYLMISQPFNKRNLSHRGALFTIVFVWIYTSAITLPPLFGWGEYVNESANISCSVNWEEQSMNAMTYIIYLFVFGLLIPLCVIVFSYVNILLTMKKKKFKMGRVNKAENKIAFIVLLMIVAFLLAWLPYSVVALIVQFGDGSFITPGLSVIPALLAKSSICYNPIIYIGLNSQFRQSLKQIKNKQKKFHSCETYTMPMTKFVYHNQEQSQIENVENLDKDCDHV